MSKISNGKVAVSEKKPTPFIGGMDDIFGNQLSVSPEIKAALAEKKLAHRWIDYRKVVDNGGHHEKGWRPVKRSECGIVDSVPSFGESADGYIRRGSLVLAVRPQEINERHKALLRQQALTTSQVQRNHAEELRKYAKSAGIDIKVTEGYEDE